MSLTQLQATGQPFPAGEPDVQRTSLSLDVLGRFVCSTWDEATTNPDFDAVVIGSGMYGSYAAAKIYAAECAGLFFLLELLFQSPSWKSVLLAPVFGAAAGTAAFALGPRPLLQGLVVTAVFLLFGAVAGRHIAYYVVGMPAILSLGVLLGRIHEMQRFDNSER